MVWNCSKYWDGNGTGSAPVCYVEQFFESYTTMVAGLSSSTAGIVVWLRGGGALYQINSSIGKAVTAEVKLEGFTDSAEQTFSVRDHNATTINNEIKKRWANRSTNGVFDNNNRVYSAVNKPTPADIGAAASSHGTHVTYGGNGSATTVSRSDHTHSYLPLSGGTMTGDLKFTDVTSTTYPADSKKIIFNGSTDGADIFYRVEAADKGTLMLNLRDDTNTSIAFAYAGSIKSRIDTSGNFSGKASTAGTADTAKAMIVKSNNTITTTTDDTTAKWGPHQTSVHWYTTAGQLNNQPAQYGYLLNVGQGSEVHQLWMTQSSGTMYHRGGNSSGWNGSWRALIDNSNLTSYVTPSTIGAAPNYQDRAMIDINTSGFSSSGSKATDANASLGSCYQFTTTSTATKLAAGNFATVKFGKYALCLRMMTSNNTTTSNLVTVTVKNGSTSILSKSIKGTDFTSTSQYSNIYTSFDFNGSRGTLSLDITTTTTSGVTVKFEYAYISLMTPSVFI